MTATMKITYIACQTCHAKVNCGECEKRLEEALMRLQGVRGASIQMAQKQVMVDADMDEDDLLDCLEEIGIFANKDWMVK